MMRWRVALVSLAILVAAAEPAHAGPVFAGIAAVASWVSGTAVTAATVSASLLSTAIATGLSYVAQALMGGQKQSPFGVSGTTQFGGTVPRSFLFGEKAFTAGSDFYPRRTWGKDGKTPNAYYSRFIALSDLPMGPLAAVYVDKTRCEYLEAGGATAWGYPLTEFSRGGKDYVWVRFHDGRQTTPDTWARSQFGSDPDYPYGADMVGHGCAYVIVTALVNQELFSSFPEYGFEGAGAAFYDQRADSTAGGDGAQRWDDPTTWEVTGNPAVIKANVLRGVHYGDQWLYGGQNVVAERLPADCWFAAMNAADAEVETAPGITEAQYRCGGEVSINTAPADFLDELNKCDNGRLTEAAGYFITRSGAAGAAVMSFTSKELLVTEAKTFDPFPGLEETTNAFSSQHPDPDQGWTIVDAPALFSDTLEALDGNRRLVAPVQYTFVPYPRRVQMLQKSAREEARKFRRHTAFAPPRAVPLRPFDIIALTDPDEGYEGKLFEVVPIDQDNLDQVLALQEVDPADYTFDPDTDHKTYTPVPIAAPGVPAQPMVGWGADPAEVDGDEGRAQAGIKLSWGVTDIDDVDGIVWQVRLASNGSLQKSGESPHSVEQFLLGETKISGGLSGNTAYEVQGKFRPISNRETIWSSWLAVTTPDVRITEGELSDDLQASIALIDEHSAALETQRDVNADLDKSRRGLADALDRTAKQLLRTQLLFPDLESRTSKANASYRREILTLVEDNKRAQQTVFEELRATVNGLIGADDTIGLAARITSLEDVTADLEAGKADASDLAAVEAEIYTPDTGLRAQVNTLIETVDLLDPESATAAISQTAIAARAQGAKLGQLSDAVLKRILGDRDELKGINASVAGYRKDILVEVRAGQEATARSLSELSVRLVNDKDDLSALVSDEALARANEDGALASRLSLTEAALTGFDDVGTVQAAITSEENARVDADGAASNRLDDVEAVLNGFDGLNAVADAFTAQSAIIGTGFSEDDSVRDQMDLKASASSVTGAIARIDDVSAEGLLSITTEVVGGDIAARGAWRMRVEVDGDVSDAAVFLDAVYDDDDLKSYLTLVGDRVTITNGVDADSLSNALAFEDGILTLAAARIRGTLDVDNLIAPEGIIGEKVQIGGVLKPYHFELSSPVTTGTGVSAEAEIKRGTVTARGGPMLVWGWLDASKAAGGTYASATIRIYRTALGVSHSSGDLVNVIPFAMANGAEGRPFSAEIDDGVFDIGDQCDWVIVVRNEATSNRPIQVTALEMTVFACR